MTAKDHPPDPFWKWDWRSPGWFHRLWLGYRLVAPVATAAGVVAALIFFGQGVPSAWDPVFWRSAEYEKVTRIHAGFELGYVSQTLGAPQMIESAAVGTKRFRQLLYLRREHVVQVVVDDTDRVVLYAVMSCSPEFQPEFSAGSQKIRLQDRALASVAEPAVTDLGSDASDPPRLNDRVLSYSDARSGTVSTPEYYLENWGGSNADLQRSYFVGVNAECLQPEALEGYGDLTYAGASDRAPADVRSFRSEVSANVYAEISGLDLPLRPVDAGGAIPALRFGIGPDSFLFPSSFLDLDPRTRIRK